jgi:uncharacterized protein (DUF4415 family)
MSGKRKLKRAPTSWAEARRLAHAAAAAMSDAEDAALVAAAGADPDNPPTDGLAFKRRRGQRGPQKSKPLKERVSLRLSPQVVEHFRAAGPGWQSRINTALERAVARERRR